MYCLVEFIGPSPSIAIAHRNWINGSKCFWPPFWKDTNKLKNALLRGVSPNTETWQLFEIHIIGNRYFATYDEARKKQMLPDDRLDASDLSSAEELQRLRKRKRAPSVNDGSESSEEMDISQLKMFKTPSSGRTKKKARTNAKMAARPPTPPSQVGSGQSPCVPSLIAVEQLYGTTLGGSARLTKDTLLDIPSSFGNETLTGHQPTDEDFGRGFERRGSLFHDLPATPRSDSHSQGIQSQRPSGIMAEERVVLPPHNGEGLDVTDISAALKSQQNQLTLLMAKTDLCVDMLRTLLQGQTKPVTGNVRFQLPLTSSEAANTVLENLKDKPDARRDLATVLSTTGGDNINQITHRVMATLMTDDLMNTYSFAGKKGKHCFRDSLFFAVVCEAVRMQPKGSIGSDKDIGKAAEYWLKKSSFRLSKNV